MHPLLVLTLTGCLSDVRIGEGRDTAPTGCVEACDRARVFTQSSVVDVLLVVDNSASMSEEHMRLASGLRDLLERAVGPHHDLHLGMLATELDDPQHGGRLVEVEGERFSAGADVLAAATWAERALQLVGPNESNVEKARAVVQEALTTHEADVNAGFRRDRAHLAILVLTDEDDASGAMPTVDAFVDWLHARWGLPSVTVHAIVGELDDSAAGCAGAHGMEHLELVEVTGGTQLSVCEPDYGPFLGALGQLVILEGLATRFVVGEAVEAGSLAVEVTYPSGFHDELDASDFAWSEDDLAIVLDSPPPAGSEIAVTYRLP